MESIAEPSPYAQVMRDAWGYGAPGSDAAHFPPTIPASATNVRFFHQPGMMQAGSHVFVRYTLPPAEFASVVAALSSTTRPVTRPTPDAGPHMVPVPTHFAIHWLTPPPTAPGNHGRGGGVAYDPSTRQVMYFAEQW